jgi:hypothetical protein
MNQTYQCSHCGQTVSSIFGVFLHIFTTHMHVDIGLDPPESIEMLGQTVAFEGPVQTGGN